MGVIALVMAGGRATRMKSSFEKPLVKICGKPMIERVIRVLRSSKCIDDIVVATSRFTPKTAEMMRTNSINVVETSGEDYHADMRYVIKKCALFCPVMVISVDLPLITKELIDEIIARYKRCGKPSLMVAVQVRAYERLGLKSEYPIKVNGEWLVPVGININDGRYISEPSIAQEILVLDRAEPVVNVNTWADLEIAEKLLHKRTLKPSTTLSNFAAP